MKKKIHILKAQSKCNYHVTDLSHEREAQPQSSDTVILPWERLTEQECKHGS